jgi:hypothetical protein
MARPKSARREKRVIFGRPKSVENGNSGLAMRHDSPANVPALLHSPQPTALKKPSHTKQNVWIPQCKCKSPLHHSRGCCCLGGSAGPIAIDVGTCHDGDCAVIDSNSASPHNVDAACTSRVEGSTARRGWKYEAAAQPQPDRHALKARDSCPTTASDS